MGEFALNGKKNRVDLNRLTPVDVVVIILILVTSIGLILKTQLDPRRPLAKDNAAIVFHDGKLTEKYALDQNKEISLLDGKMVLEVKDGKIRV